MLAASLQFRTLPTKQEGASQRSELELVLTPAVELLIAQKPSVLQVSVGLPMLWGVNQPMLGPTNQCHHGILVTSSFGIGAWLVQGALAQLLPCCPGLYCRLWSAYGMTRLQLSALQHQQLGLNLGRCRTHRPQQQRMPPQPAKQTGQVPAAASPGAGRHTAATRPDGKARGTGVHQRAGATYGQSE